MTPWMFWTLIGVLIASTVTLCGYLARMCGALEVNNIMLSDVRALLSNWSDQNVAEIRAHGEELQLIRDELRDISAVAAQYKHRDISPY